MAVLNPADAIALVELVHDTPGSFPHLEEYVGAENELIVGLFPNVIRDVEHAVLEVDFRNSADPKHSIQIAFSHTHASASKTPERPNSRSGMMNASFRNTVNPRGHLASVKTCQAPDERGDPCPFTVASRSLASINLKEF